jgi:RNA polymerase sigma-70 factor, ECF subfamily
MTNEDRVAREGKMRSAILRGDELAWQHLYEESFERLWNYVEWRSGSNQCLAEDVVQETWVVAVRRIRDFAPWEAGFTTWLCGIAAKTMQALLRRERSIRQRVSLDKELPARTADRQAIDEDIGFRIATALANLPERFEAVLRAKYLDSMAVNAIAASWGETPKAIESLLTRAREAFRQAYFVVGDQANRDHQSGREDSGSVTQPIA